MTGINTYSTTAAENVAANTGITWDEGMNAGLVNNSARQNMADTRLAFNDLIWFQYGVGTKTVPAVYASITSVTLAGVDATAAWEAGRRVRAIGASTGTIYGKVASSSFAASTTTVNITWDSGSLTNEALAVYLSQIPVTGSPAATPLKQASNQGSITLPGGLIIKWGHSLDTTMTAGVTFNEAFPNNFYSVTASVDSAAANATGVAIINNGSFTLYKASTNAAYWMAFGN